MRKILLLPLLSFVVALAPRTQAQTPNSALKMISEFDLPGPPEKCFDYLTIDPDHHYLIPAHLAADVIDLRTNKVVATIADTPGAEGVEYVPELKKFYMSNAGDNAIGRRHASNESREEATDRTQA